MFPKAFSMLFLNFGGAPFFYLRPALRKSRRHVLNGGTLPIADLV
jgi:hypothetical protein